MSRAKRWCFTLNNYTEEEYQTLIANDGLCEYLVVGKERGAEGTPHLQGYVEWKAAVRLTTCKTRLGSQRYHVEVARGSAQENRTYCTKEGDFAEIGTFPSGGQGKRTDLDAFYEWSDTFANANGRVPTTPEMATEFPAVLTKFPRVREVVRLRCQRRLFFVDPEPRQWQRELALELDGTADDRKIIFVVDPDGGKGKSWFVRWFLDMHPHDTQFMSSGKRDDIAHAVRERTRVFLFDIPRGQMQFLQMSILEMLKNRLVFSPKYSSTTKVLEDNPHVVVFSNEYPDQNALTEDRYKFI